jgi:hypothetical protein
MLGEWWILKGVEGRSLDLILDNIPAFAWRDRGNHENRSPGRDLNPGPPEYESVKSAIINHLPQKVIRCVDLGFPHSSSTAFVYVVMMIKCCRHISHLIFSGMHSISPWTVVDCSIRPWSLKLRTVLLPVFTSLMWFLPDKVHRFNPSRSFSLGPNEGTVPH